MTVSSPAARRWLPRSVGDLLLGHVEPPVGAILLCSMCAACQSSSEPAAGSQPAVAATSAIRRGIRSFGPDNQTVIIFESLMDSKSLFLTANTESIYAMTWLNLKDGPVVVESPPNTLGLVDDFWFRYVTDLGNAGPDKGQGGKFLFLPPGYKGNPPAGYHVVRSRTFGNADGSAVPKHRQSEKRRRDQCRYVG